MSEKLVLSTLGHTWILDLDGTLLKHNGYLIDGEDTLLTGALDFIKSIPEKDMIIFVTSRTEEYRQRTIRFLREKGIRYHYIIFGAPYGERIVVNDRKPSGLATGYAVNKNRDSIEFPVIEENDRL